MSFTLAADSKVSFISCCDFAVAGRAAPRGSADIWAVVAGRESGAGVECDAAGTLCCEAVDACVAVVVWVLVEVELGRDGRGSCEGGGASDTDGGGADELMGVGVTVGVVMVILVVVAGARWTDEPTTVAPAPTQAHHIQAHGQPLATHKEHSDEDMEVADLHDERGAAVGPASKNQRDHSQQPQRPTTTTERPSLLGTYNVEEEVQSGLADEQHSLHSVAFRPRSTEQREKDTRAQRRVTYTVGMSDEQPPTHKESLNEGHSATHAQTHAHAHTHAPTSPANTVTPKSTQRHTRAPHTLAPPGATLVIPPNTPTAGLRTGPLLPGPGDIGALLREGCVYEPTAIAGNTKVSERERGCV